MAHLLTLILGTFVLAVFMPEAPMLAPVIIWVLAAVLMMAYDHGPALKDRGLVGNVSISVLVGAVVLFGASAAGAWSHPVALAAAVAALVNLAREIVKDVHDLEVTRSSLDLANGRWRGARADDRLRVRHARTGGALPAVLARSAVVLNFVPGACHL